MKMEQLTLLLKRYLGWVLCALALLVGTVSLDGYGINWDETQQRRTGSIAYSYVFEGDDGFLEWKDRDYGLAFELPLIIFEKAFHLTDSRNVYLMRHWLTHFFFLLGCYFFFRLIDYLYQNKLLATLGFLLLLLQPRLYAHSFFNSKDIPFMAMLIISLYYAVVALDKKTTLSFLKLGVCAGLLINLRIMGVILPAMVLPLLVVDALNSKNRLPALKGIGIVLAVACLTLYTTWPLLWTAPIDNFVFAFKNMSKFRWGGTVLFFGDMVKATEIDWTYFPVWFSMTNPIPYLLLGLSGLLLLIVRGFKAQGEVIKNTHTRHNVLFAFLFLAPILVVIVLKSVLYDGWRQLYFVYPAFALLIVYGLHRIQQTQLFKPTLGLLAISFVATSVFMVRSYPVQNVYFNNALAAAPPEYLRKNFEQDYWGTSYKQAIEHVLAQVPDSTISICLANTPDPFNKELLRKKDRVRVQFLPEAEAQFFITNYRWHPQNYKEYQDRSFHSISINGSTVCETFKLK